MPIRKDLKSCSKAKIRRANKRLNRIQKQIPKLKINIQWNQGVSRWIARYAQAVAAYGMGKSAKAKRLAKRTEGLYVKAQKTGPILGPSSSPNTSSMFSGMYAVMDGRYFCGRGE
ncbi:MAG: hypothetical protein IPK93_12435 [Solirubrobacterales bacterium]|nr:hypothetical protein [Solirubrobacterales bacterium]